MDVVHWLFDAVKWLIGLADPKNLGALVHEVGPWVSYGILTGVIFSETGLLIGFFLPGDSLLFAAGFVASQDAIPIEIGVLVACLTAAAIVGDAVNYFLGRQMGEQVFEKGRLRFVKHEHLMAAKDFYERHGAIAIVLARFVPLVRTFTPFVAGVARMGYRKFAFYNVTGGIGWVLSMSLAGYWLGRIPLIQRNFEKAVLLVVFISVLPMFVGALRKWRQVRAARLAGKPAVGAAAPVGASEE